MRRFYVAPHNIRERRVSFSQEQEKYIKRVLRLQEGAEVAVTDGMGKAYLCRLLFSSPSGVEGTLTGLLKEDREPRLRVILYQALPKGDRMDQVVQKSVELGVAEIVPMITQRCVVRLDPEKGDSRQQRWQKIAMASLEQSGRNRLTRIREPLIFPRALAEGQGVLSIMPWEGEDSRSMRSLLEFHLQLPALRIFIGPEGGFSPGEAREAAVWGIHTVTLGPRILRTETAGPAVIAMALYHYGDLG